MLSQALFQSQALSLVGIKSAESQLHEYGRVIIIVLLLGLIAWEIYSEKRETNEIEEIEHLIKRDSIIYNAIKELDPDSQVKCIKQLKATLMSEPESIFNKYYKNVSIALIAAICSEYIINGNLSKPIGGIAKTVVSTIWNTSLV